MNEPERLQKFLARAGIASRRSCESLITSGRVKVNGKVVNELGTKIVPGTDIVEMDGHQVNVDGRFVYILLNKPGNFISAASDPEGRPVVTSLVPPDYGRLYPVGRLDWDSEGALLLTNDGELANLLTHPRHQVQKTYMVKVRGIVGEHDKRIEELREGVMLDRRRTLPAEVFRDADTGKHTWFVVGIREGRNRQIRRMCDAVGLDVLRLRRVAYGPLPLGDLAPGAYRRLSEEEIEELYDAAGQTRPEMNASRGRLPASKRSGKAKAQAAAKRDPDDNARPTRGAPKASGGETKRGAGTRGAPKASGGETKRGAGTRGAPKTADGEMKRGAGTRGAPKASGGETKRATGRRGAPKAADGETKRAGGTRGAPKAADGETKRASGTRGAPKAAGGDAERKPGTRGAPKSAVAGRPSARRPETKPLSPKRAGSTGRPTTAPKRGGAAPGKSRGGR